MADILKTCQTIQTKHICPDHLQSYPHTYYTFCWIRNPFAWPLSNAPRSYQSRAIHCWIIYMRGRWMKRGSWHLALPKDIERNLSRQYFTALFRSLIDNVFILMGYLRLPLTYIISHNISNSIINSNNLEFRFLKWFTQNTFYNITLYCVCIQWWIDVKMFVH